MFTTLYKCTLPQWHLDHSTRLQSGDSNVYGSIQTLPMASGGGCKFRSMGAALDCLNILGLCPCLHSSFKHTLAMSLLPIRMCEFISARHCIFHCISIIIFTIFMHWELGSVVVVEGRPSWDHNYSQVRLRGQTQRWEAIRGTWDLFTEFCTNVISHLFECTDDVCENSLILRWDSRYRLCKEEEGDLKTGRSRSLRIAVDSLDFGKTWDASRKAQLRLRQHNWTAPPRRPFSELSGSTILPKSS